jgi:predicted membrane protein
LFSRYIFHVMNCTWRSASNVIFNVHHSYCRHQLHCRKKFIIATRMLILFSELTIVPCLDVLRILTLNLLTWRIWWAPNNASKRQMGFNWAFKGLILIWAACILILSFRSHTDLFKQHLCPSFFLVPYCPGLSS